MAHVRIPTAVQDAAYVAVGFGVLGFQRAQVRRRELARRLDGRRPDLGAGTGTASTQLSDVLRGLGAWAEPVRREIDGQLDALEHRLPGQARRTLRTARDAVRGTEAQVRHIVGL